MLWPTPELTATVTLQTHDGLPFTRADLDADWTLLFFGFTHCPDVCHTTTAVLNQVRGDMAATGEAPRVVFVSLDPDRDAGERLAGFVGRYDGGVIGVTGSQEAVDSFAREIGVVSKRVEKGETYELDHSTMVFALAPGGRLVTLFRQPLDVAETSQQLRAMQRFIAAQG